MCVLGFGLTLGFKYGFAEARLEMVDALARLPGRMKGVWDLSVVWVWGRVGVEVGGGMVRDWRLGFSLTDGEGVLAVAVALVPFCLLSVLLFCFSTCCLTESGRESEP